jgi:hypothetical protein
VICATAKLVKEQIVTTAIIVARVLMFAFSLMSLPAAQHLYLPLNTGAGSPARQ